MTGHSRFNEIYLDQLPERAISRLGFGFGAVVVAVSCKSDWIYHTDQLYRLFLLLFNINDIVQYALYSKPSGYHLYDLVLSVQCTLYATVRTVNWHGTY